jgi:Na/Pi-cotransporter
MVSLKLDTLALPAIAVGVTVALAARRSITRNLAHTLIGFGLLFLGMTMMSSQLKELSHFPSFVRFFSMFDCEPRVAGGFMPWTAVLGALAIGTVMTMVVQSSSATIGLTIALATSGLLNFYTAIPLILGDNIGTTITALLASIGTNRQARQAAVAHTVFKMIGATYMIALLYVRVDGVPVFLAAVDAITSGEVFAAVPENIGRHVAAAHTLFNVVNVLVFLPFTGWLAWLCERLMPAPSGENGHIQMLEPHLLNTPSIALLQVRHAVGEMCRESWETTQLAFESLTSSNHGIDDDVRRREERIDQMQRETIDYLVKLTQRQLTERESEAVPRLMHCVNDAERVGDHAINVLELSAQIREERTRLSRPATTALDELLALVEAQAAEICATCRQASAAPPVKAIRLEGEIRRLAESGEQKHERRLRRGKCSVDAGIAFVELLSNIQRIGEHYGNIAQRIADVVELEPSD